MRVTLRELRSAKVLLPLDEATDILRQKRAAVLRDLVSESPANSKVRKARCSARFVGFNKGDTTWHLTYRVTCTESYSDPAGHTVKLRLYPEVGISDALDLDVEASCSCPAFVYWGAQWNLNVRKSLERVQDGSMLSAPTQSRHNFIVCKHIATVADKIQLLLAKHLQKFEQDQL
jgi:hypothetical protein